MAKVGKGFQVGLSWVNYIGGEVPHGAIETQPGIYIARGRHEGEVIPGKFVYNYNLCYVPYGGGEVQLTECEILCDTSVTGCGDWSVSQPLLFLLEL